MLLLLSHSVCEVLKVDLTFASQIVGKSRIRLD